MESLSTDIVTPTHPLSTARFPSVPSGAGHYESFYVKVADPQRPRGVWIRYTAFKRVNRAPVGSLWAVVWPENGSPIATKKTDEPGTLGVNVGEYVHVGDSSLVPGRATGVMNDVSWNLDFSQQTPLFHYQPKEWLYRSPVPRTKSVALHPYAQFHGSVAAGGQEFDIDGWPGMVGHNWGAEHAEEWIWLHGARFREAPDAWFDGTMVRIRLGPFTLPWIANAALRLGGRTYRLNGKQNCLLEAQRTQCKFSMSGSGLTVQGTVAAPASQYVAWRYADPAGGEHITTNCSVAALTLDVIDEVGTQREQLYQPAGAAYELGRRGEPDNIRTQPFTDP